MKAKYIWDLSPKKKKIELLKVLGYKKDLRKWVDISWDDLPKRSGGMIQKDIYKLNQIRLKRNKH